MALFCGIWYLLLVYWMQICNYINILKQNLLSSADKLGIHFTLKFYQDNDPKHKAYKTREWLLYNCPCVDPTAVPWLQFNGKSLESTAKSTKPPSLVLPTSKNAYERNGSKSQLLISDNWFLRCQDVWMQLFEPKMHMPNTRSSDWVTFMYFCGIFHCLFYCLNVHVAPKGWTFVF